MTPSSPRFDVLGLGALAVDDLLYVDGYPAANEKVRVHHRERQCGGLTGTALVAAARLGAKTAYGGLLGHDPLSRYVIEQLEREGVDFSPAVPDDDARPGHSTIVVDAAAGSRTVFSSLAGRLGPAKDRPSAAEIAAARVLLIDHHGLEGTLRATRVARQAKTAVVADFERDPGSPFDELLPLVDHPIVSQRFAAELTGKTDPAEAARVLWCDSRGTVVVTCGEQGCWYVDEDHPDNPVHQAAFAVDVADTTGCGDVFHGAYAAALAQGESAKTRILVASAAAALKATRRGGQAGIPDKEDLAAFLAK